MSGPGKAPEEELVCYCKKIGKKDIVKAIKAGFNTLSAIKKETTACTGGKCKELNPKGRCCSTDILELIRIHSENDNNDGIIRLNTF